MDSLNICTACHCSKCKQSAPQEKSLAAVQEKTLTGSDIGSDVDTKKQIRYGSRYQAAWGIFSEYCDNSTIHGIKYLGEQKRPILERIFWIFVFVLSLYTCGSLLMNVWHKWNNNPVVLVFDEELTPVHQIPFPTVTVCLETKSRPKIFHYSTVLHHLSSGLNLTQKEQFHLEAIGQICFFLYYEFGKTFANFSDLIKAFQGTGPDPSEVFDQCRWRNSSCYKLIHPVLTEEGICYSLNVFGSKGHLSGRSYAQANKSNLEYDDYSNADDDAYLISSSDRKYEQAIEWDLENGYNSNASKDAFPYRVSRSGKNVGVKMGFSFNPQKNEFECRNGAEGVKIVLTTPGEIPKVSEQYIPIPIDEEVMISIKPEIIRTSEGLRHYTPMRRRCYFQNERYLRYFKLYTESSCKLECLTNFTLQQCECVKFSMPSAVDTPVCGARKLHCMIKAVESFFSEESRLRPKTAVGEFNHEDDCNCLPSCTSITYNFEVSHSKLFVDRSGRKLDGLEDKRNQKSRLRIFFKEAQFLTMKRSELYSTTDFIANCGGLLGLLMGISTLSIVELVYFCTVRMITNLRMRRRKRLQRLQNEKGAVAVLEIIHTEV